MSGTVIFVVVSCLLAYVSRHSLKIPSSHGFFRFLAWEAMLPLFILNAALWFDDITSPQQMLSWFLLFCSLVLVAPGTYAFLRSGNISPLREDPGLFPFERTTTLITTGAYRYIRHPMYSALLFLAWGTYFKDPSWPGTFLAIAASILLFKTATADESECIGYFGKAYREYMRTTRRFVPFLF